MQHLAINLKNFDVKTIPMGMKGQGESLGDLKLPGQQEIRFTATGRYDDLAVHIACHRKIQERRHGEAMSYKKATSSWHRSVYLPIVQMIRDSGVLKYMPQRTEADFYVWLLRHWDSLFDNRDNIFLPNKRLKRKFLSPAI